MDAQYLRQTVGPILAEGVRCTKAANPADPLHYLGHWLKNYVAVCARQEEHEKTLGVIAEQREERKGKEEAKIKAEEEARLQEDALIAGIVSSSNKEEMFKKIISALETVAGVRHAYVGIPYYRPLTEEEAEERAELRAQKEAEEAARRAEAGEDDDDAAASEVADDAPEDPDPEPELLIGHLKYVAESAGCQFPLLGQELERGKGLTWSIMNDDPDLSKAKEIEDGETPVPCVYVENTLDNPGLHLSGFARFGQFATSASLSLETGRVATVIAMDTMANGRTISPTELDFLKRLTKAIQHPMDVIAKENQVHNLKEQFSTHAERITELFESLPAVEPPLPPEPEPEPEPEGEGEGDADGDGEGSGDEKKDETSEKGDDESDLDGSSTKEGAGDGSAGAEADGDGEKTNAPAEPEIPVPDFLSKRVPWKDLWQALREEAEQPGWEWKEGTLQRTFKRMWDMLPELLQKQAPLYGLCREEFFAHFMDEAILEEHQRRLAEEAEAEAAAAAAAEAATAEGGQDE
eukprot:Rmarinus@m.27714